MGFLSSVLGSVTGNGLLSAGTSVLGSLLNSSSQSSANATNLQIARENNQFNAEQAQLDRDFQAQQSELAYNRSIDYTRQKQEYEAAGINPYLAMQNGGSVGQVSAAQGAQAQSAGLPNVSATNPGNGLLQASQVFANIAAGEAAAKKAAADAGEALSRTDLNKNELKWADDLARNALLNGDSQRSLNSMNRMLIAQSIGNMQTEQKLKEIEAIGASIDVAWLPAEKKQQLANMAATYEKLIADGTLSYAQAQQQWKLGYMYLAQGDQAHAFASEAPPLCC